VKSVRSRTLRARFVAGWAVLLCAALVVPGAARAQAETNATNDSDINVVVPEATPTATTPPPTTAPPTTTPPTADGDNNGGGNNGNGGGGSGNNGNGNNAGTGGGVSVTSTPSSSANTTSCASTEPSVPSSPAKAGNEASFDKDIYYQGDTVNVTANRFTAGEQVQLVVFSDPTLIGTFAADETGTVRATFTVSDSMTTGAHTLQFTGWCKTVALGSVLIGSTGQGQAHTWLASVPVAVWWILGVLLVLALAYGAWRVWRVLSESDSDSGRPADGQQINGATTKPGASA